MWQVAVAAAVAGGSGFLAKHLFSHPEQHTHQDQTLQDSPQGDVGGVFRFSSLGSPPDSTKTRVSQKKKIASGVGVIRRGKILGRLKNANCDHRNNGGKRVSISIFRLKRRKTNRVCKETPLACSTDQSAFGWGLGLGMMYMMSSGKAEVSKLSHAIDDTAKAVHELKSELNKNKSSELLENVDDTATNITPKSTIKKADIEPSTSNKHSVINSKFITQTANSEYASSVLTEEYQPEGGEMEHLEAELESELQKLPWCDNEISEEGNIMDAVETERRGSMTQRAVTYQSGGVSPAELKNKLSYLLLKQQEGHITELESELNLAYSKLEEKEAEMRALKDCVKRLTEFSFSTVSAYEEIEGSAAKDENVEVANTGSQNAVVGMKRLHGYECTEILV